MAYNVQHFAMFGAGTILARSAQTGQNMGVSLRSETEQTVAAYCVLADVVKSFLICCYYFHVIVFVVFRGKIFSIFLT